MDLVLFIDRQPDKAIYVYEAILGDTHLIGNRAASQISVIY